MADSGRTLMTFKPFPAKKDRIPPLRQMDATASASGLAACCAAIAAWPLTAASTADWRVWAMRKTLMRSKGAVAVRERAPAIPPEKKYPIT
jgi:hypothetical protein